ncbi:PQQ-binding-like beta-propeller repeat protein [Paenibacillus pseudetheri]|uniref:Outer membrane protein assembly factor BamB n=1 Tax=Paenibacillus pseudetheri TaxID=2897682 RepID=A0ABN8FN22_9BACL|nr:PQQ-binding-like beta-propeller repeat protein [Paenibacillus pseudetheri]CAH1056981.1 Outer membrane protein assembly factor BamB [Paenibacillus pseudetheri]
MKYVPFMLKTAISSSLLVSGAGLYLPGAQAATSTTSSSTAADTVTTIKPLWHDKTDGQGIYSQQSPISNGLFYYSSGGTLKAVDLTTGKVKWSYKNGSNPEIITNNSVFFITNEGYLVKVNAQTGKLLWKVKAAKDPIEIGAFTELVSGVLYFRNEHGGIAAYHPVTGKKIWENKDIPMYVGSIDGLYDGVLVVSSTVDNRRTQFFGLDPATGKRLWRIQGFYSFVAYRHGQLILREQANASNDVSNEPIKGYQLTLVHVDVNTGKAKTKENYKPLEDVSRLGNTFTSLQGSYLYTVDGSLDNFDGNPLYRFTLSQETTTEPKSFEEYGNWVAGPVNNMAFFQNGTQMTGVPINDNEITSFNGPDSPALSVQLIGKGIYAGYENGYFHILNAETGKALGKVKTGAQQYGKLFSANGILYIQTEHDLFAISLPKELK